MSPKVKVFLGCDGKDFHLGKNCQNGVDQCILTLTYYVCFSTTKYL